MFSFISQTVGNHAFEFNFIKVTIQRTMTRLGEALTFNGFPKFKIQNTITPLCRNKTS
jgi:hypothetical protein